MENHHVSSVFELMKNEEFNIFADFSKEDYKIIRERVIAIVLATDMSTHFGDVAKLKGRLAAGTINNYKLLFIHLIQTLTSRIKIRSS